MANQTPPTLEDQNFHFWSSVIRGYSFRDVNVEVPIAWSKSYVYVTVDGSDFNGYGLPFYAYLNRDRSEIGCYLTWRKGYEKEKHIFEEIVAPLERLRGELGDDLEPWTNHNGHPRVGFRRATQFQLLHDYENAEYRCAVAWMQDHLDRLVSTLYPRIQRMLLAGS